MPLNEIAGRIGGDTTDFGVQSGQVVRVTFLSRGYMSLKR
jgi:hypothetical protein